MTAQDIRGQIGVIHGSLLNIKTLEQRMQGGLNGEDAASATKQLDESKEQIMHAALTLVETMLVDLNRIAEALEFVAKQHNSSEALFRA